MESGNDRSRLDAVGVDVSKASLDAHRLATGESRRFANDARGIEELARWVGDSTGNLGGIRYQPPRQPRCATTAVLPTIAKRTNAAVILPRMWRP